VFFDVTQHPDKLAEMLTLSDGARRVPVIVRGQTVTVGYNRGS
jgi:hypothetical protein